MKTLFKAIAESMTVCKDSNNCFIYYGQLGDGTESHGESFIFDPDKSYRIIIDGTLITIKER
jgi:hypothetical protein